MTSYGFFLYTLRGNFEAKFLIISIYYMLLTYSDIKMFITSFNNMENHIKTLKKCEAFDDIP